MVEYCVVTMKSCFFDEIMKQLSTVKEKDNKKYDEQKTQECRESGDS